MILAGESGLDGSRALYRKTGKPSEYGRRMVCGRDKRGFSPGANVVYDDWLVGEDIFVFCGHSARAARIDYSLRVVSWGKGLCFDCRDAGWTRKRELRRVGAAVAQNVVQARLDRFLADVGHDSITSSENHQLFPLVVLDMSRAGRAFTCHLYYNCSHKCCCFSSQRLARSVTSGRPQVSANVCNFFLAHYRDRTLSCRYLTQSESTGICFGTNSSILRLDIPDNPSKPCLSCTKQWCLNQNLPICAGATLGDTDPDTATGKEGDVEARCFRMYIPGGHLRATRFRLC